MPSPQELETKFWKALKSDRTLMLGLDGVEDGHARPMTAQIEDDRGPIWFFTSKDNAMVAEAAARGPRDRDLRVKGARPFRHAPRPPCGRHRSRAIDRLWNRFVAAWFEGGKDDPKLALLRLDAGAGRDLAGRVEPRGGREDAARHRPQEGLQGQSRRSASQLTDPEPFGPERTL